MTFSLHPPLPLAVVDISDPLLWAAFIGWIMSVVLHEFAHGVVAHFGGDYTIRERGGLTLNPFQYIDPMMSLLFPAIIFVMGGVPLPGGVTYIRRDLIRSRAWQIATSAAGPAMNFILFLALCLPFHPTVGWIDPPSPRLGGEVPNAYLFLGAMAWLQMLSVLLNLIPVPPLDGFQIVGEFMPPETRDKLMSMGWTLYFIFFAILWRTPGASQLFHNGVLHTMEGLGFDLQTTDFFGDCFNRVLFGK
jgi:Zn-dependent protease